MSSTLCDICDKDARYAAAKAENAKLRELVADYFNAPCVTCDPWGDGFRCTHCESGNCTLAIRTLELGIEVDG